MSELALSVVAPAHNEAENVRLLVEEVGRACEAAIAQHPAFLAGGFELVVVDDASTDAMPGMLAELRGSTPWLRSLHLPAREDGKGHGQSAAFKAGFAAARGRWIASLDADLQNDPADLPRMVALLGESGADMVQGDRSHARKDNAVRRWGSRVGRLVRRWLLADTIRDTGCSLRVMRREIAVALPLEFKGLHRFIPVTARQLGYEVVEMPVNHRPRHAGTPKYGLGITQRALPGLVDCLAVRWMGRRRRIVEATEATELREVAAPSEVAAG